MKVTVVVVGRVRGALAPVVEDFERRCGHYWKLEVVEVDAGAGGRDDRSAVLEAEADRILARIPEGVETVVLTRPGKPMDSRSLAELLGEHQISGSQGVCFVIGGAFGVHDRVLRRARRRLSFSPMTFPHEMARLLLMEQLYRAGTILRGEPYHKGP